MSNLSPINVVRESGSSRRLGARRRGFTLIELVVVILILAILAALIVPRVVGRTSDAKRAKAASDISTLRSLVAAFHLDNDRYPTTEEGLQALRTRPSDAPQWHGPYTDKDIPVDPWGHDYDYQTTGDDFTIISYGSDGAPGGDGDAADIGEDISNQGSQ